MKKIDKLVLRAFLGPFFLTFLVVVFILLTQHMLKYFDDLVGKDLGWDVLGQLVFYFAVFMTPIGLPLGVLLSSLMTFGNLGEHSELTALKSGGISLPRTMRSLFFFVILVSVFAFYSNNYFVPKAALEAYSLLWDIKRKKPSLDINEGEFYGGINDYSIKVEKKFPDGITLKGIIIYDHTSQMGNKEITLADSGIMSTIMNEQYLKLELFNGYTFMEGKNNSQGVSRDRRQSSEESFSRVKFARSEIVFDLSSFDMDRTDKDLFSRNRLMRNLDELNQDIDSMNIRINRRKLEAFYSYGTYFQYHLNINTPKLPLYLEKFKIEQDSIAREKRKIQEQVDKLEKLSAKDDSLEVVDPGLKEPGNQDTIRKLEAKNRIKRKLDTGTEENVTQARPANKVPVGNSSIIPKVPVMDSLDKKKMKEIIANSGLSKSGIELDSLKKKGRKIPTRINTDSTRLKVLSKVDLGGKDSSSFKENINIAVLIDSILEDRESDDRSLNMAVNNARQAKTRLESMSGTVDVQDFEKRIFQIQWHKIIANAIACFTMFLIGAPLGAIIKKGGLGIPVLLSILFFIIFYVLTMMGEKWAKQGLLDPWVGIWMANFILLPIGMFFMKQARKDARLFDSDFYNVIYQKIKKWYSLKKNSKIKTN